MKIRTMIVDDEPLAREIIETFASAHDDLEIVCLCQNAIEAKEKMATEDVDLLLLDIQMPGMTGLELLKSMDEAPVTIFTTAYPNHALEGFELNVIDYLLKPIAKDRFDKAIERAREYLELKNKSERGDELPSAADFIFVKADKKLVKINFADILYIEGLKDYVIIKTETGRVITLHTMKALEEKLPSNLFRRIHRSFIVQVGRIDAIVGNMVEIKEKNEKKQLPIGKNYRDDILALINQNRL